MVAADAKSGTEYRRLRRQGWSPAWALHLTRYFAIDGAERRARRAAMVETIGRVEAQG